MKVKLHSKMVIGECISDEAVKELENAVEESSIGDEPGFVSCQVLTETDGHMVVILTTWQDKESCYRFHGARSYRRFVEKTQHLLVGSYVVKHFETRETVGAAA